MKKVMMNFRVDASFAEFVAKEAEAFGVSESDYLRTALDEGVPGARKKLAAKLKKKAEMVRGTGFEPVTPTVSILGIFGQPLMHTIS
jgi:hypothetical protein